MKKMVYLGLCVVCCAMLGMVGCKSFSLHSPEKECVAFVVKKSKGEAVTLLPAKGVLENRLAREEAPMAVVTAMQPAVIDDRFECVLRDETAQLEVWSLLKVSDEVSSEGFGVIVVKDGVKNVFASMRHGKMPLAYFDAAKGRLWLTGGVMEGTGVHVEKAYGIEFDDKGVAHIVTEIDPYDIQNLVCEHLAYFTEGDSLTLYDQNTRLATVESTVDNMGGFYDDAVWVGEQLSFTFDAQGPKVHVVPGANFVVGKVLFYDFMPTLVARVRLEGDTMKIDDLDLVEE